MASKINAHVHGLHKPLANENPLPSPASTHSHITDAAMYDHRGSISTDRTSESMSMDDTGELLQTKRKRTPQRPKGTYRLNDFLIHRTLGTGSFGRVHLGQCLVDFFPIIY
jgi:protein kinase A